MSMSDSSLSASVPTTTGKTPLAGLVRLLPRLSSASQGWLLPLSLLLLWNVAAQRGWMAEQILPAPALVWQTAHELAA